MMAFTILTYASIHGSLSALTAAVLLWILSCWIGALTSGGRDESHGPFVTEGPVIATERGRAMVLRMRRFACMYRLRGHVGVARGVVGHRDSTSGLRSLPGVLGSPEHNLADGRPQPAG